MRTKKLDKQIQALIAGEYGKVKAKELASKYNCTLNQVYEVGKRFGITNKVNQEVAITEFQEQIILGGLLGDGRIKQNGKSNCYYSECHERGEQDYLLWKYNNLGDLTKSATIYVKDDGRVKDNALEFTTKTTPSLNKYLGLSFEEIVPRMDKLSLIVYMLDDGWLANKHGNSGNICLTTYPFSEEQRLLLHKQYKEKLGVEFHNSGVKRVNSSASSIYTENLYKATTEFIPSETDVVQKKFACVLNV